MRLDMGMDMCMDMQIDIGAPVLDCRRCNWFLCELCQGYFAYLDAPG